MSLSMIQRGHCDTHGEVLIHGSRCVCCHPAQVQIPKPVVIRRRLKAKTTGHLGRPRSTTLTPREREIACYLAQNVTQVEIAKRLGVTRAAIESTVIRALNRLGLTKTYELVKFVGGKADE